MMVRRRRGLAFGLCGAGLAAMGLAAPLPQAAAGAGAAPKPYVAACQSCHKADGSGMPGVFPRLTGRLASAAKAKDGRKWLIATVLFGQSGAIEVDGKTIRGAMPAAVRLSDADVADTLTWLAGGGKAFTAAEVAAVRAQPGMTAAQVGELRTALARAGTIK